MSIIVCQVCGKRKKGKRKDTKYCGTRCKVIAWAKRQINGNEFKNIKPRVYNH